MREVNIQTNKFLSMPKDMTTEVFDTVTMLGLDIFDMCKIIIHYLDTFNGLINTISVIEGSQVLNELSCGVIGGGQVLNFISRGFDVGSHDFECLRNIGHSVGECFDVLSHGVRLVRSEIRRGGGVVG